MLARIDAHHTRQNIMQQMLPAGYGAANIAQMAQLGYQLPGMQPMPQPQLAQQLTAQAQLQQAQLQQAQLQQAQLTAMGVSGLQSLLPAQTQPAQLSSVDQGAFFQSLPAVEGEPTAKRRKTSGKACWYYMRGLCGRGDQCLWQHDAEKVAEALAVEESATDYPAWKSQYCRFFMKSGQCRFAQYCLYAHCEAELRLKPNMAAVESTALVPLPQIMQPPATLAASAAEALLAGFDTSTAVAPTAGTAVDAWQTPPVAPVQIFPVVPSLAAPPIAAQPQIPTQSIGDLQQYLAQIAALGGSM